MPRSLGERERCSLEEIKKVRENGSDKHTETDRWRTVESNLLKRKDSSTFYSKTEVDHF